MAGDGIEMILTGVEEFKKALEQMVAQADAGAREIATKGALIIEKNAKKRAPVKRGTLRRSIRLVDVTSLGFGSYLSRTAPSVIYGRRRELGFHGWTQGQHPQHVLHDPGKPYMAPAIQDSGDELRALASAVWAKAATV
jgi:hypothetical protein